MAAEHHATESATAITAKLAPPAGISLATLFGYQVSELLILATLIYTVLLIGHKLYRFIQDVREDLDK